MVEAESQALEGVGEAVNSDANSDPKHRARQLLSEGLGIDAVAEESGLSRMVVLGISGALKKAQKKLAATEDKAAKGSPPENVGEEEITADLKREAQVTNAGVALARSQQRLKSLDPNLYQSLHGSGQSEANSPGKILADLELAKYIKQMRENESRPNNGGDSQATLGLQKQIDDLKEEMHKKDVEALKKETEKLAGEIGELRADLRHSTNSGSDLAVVVREASGLLEKAVESNGPLRAYLMPNNIDIKPRREAPELRRQVVQAEPGSGTVVSGLSKYGLVTQVLRKGD